MTPSAPRSGGQSTALPVSKYSTPSICTHCAKPRAMPEAALSFSTAAPSSASATWGAAASSIGMSGAGAVSAAASGTSAAMAASPAMLLLRSVPLRHTAAPPKTIQAHAATDTTCCQCRRTTRRRFFTGASAARIMSSSTWPMASNNSRSVTVQHPFPVSRRPACRACGAASPAPCSRSGRTARQCPPSRRSTSTGAKICCAFPPAACAETR